MVISCFILLFLGMAGLQGHRPAFARFSGLILRAGVQALTRLKKLNGKVVNARI